VRQTRLGLPVRGSIVQTATRRGRLGGLATARATLENFEKKFMARSRAAAGARASQARTDPRIGRRRDSSTTSKSGQ
jgi:hypothetical protein